MANFMIGWPNRMTYGTLTASSSEVGLPVTNMANDQGSFDQGWQTPMLQAWFRLTIPASDMWQAFSLHRTNLSKSAQVRWRVWTGTDTTAGPAYDSGMVASGIAPSYNQSVWILPHPISGQTVQCDLADANNPDGHINIPLAYAGPVWQPMRNFDPNSSAGRTMSSTKTVTRAGSVVIRSDWVKRTFTLSLSGIRAAEVWSQVMDLDLWARRGNNSLFVPDPADPLINLMSVFGELEASSDVTYPNKVVEARGWKATITERL